jgi:pimeloyl-ACP methyl ester carboxylesterase
VRRGSGMRWFVTAWLAAVVTIATPDRAASQTGRPVLCIHGFNGDATTSDAALPVLRDAGLDPIAISWRPATPDQGLAEAAEQVIAPAIEAALAERGYTPDQGLSILTHSMGGLAMRHLVERCGWADRVERMVMVSLPAHGARTGLATHACNLPRTSTWRSAGCDMRQDAPFLIALGTAPPEAIAARYLCISTSWRGSFLPGRGDLDGDGRVHGNDGVVVTESGHLDGVPLAVWEGQGPKAHRRVSCNSAVLQWAADFLANGARPSGDGRGVRAVDLCADAGARTSAGPPSAADPTTASLTLVVDATAATDPLVRFKMRQCRLQVRLDGGHLVDLAQRKPQASEIVYDASIPAGDHVLSLRWEATFRSATDRHHPMGSAPEAMGFSVPDSGWAERLLQLGEGDHLTLHATLQRKATVGLHGQTSVDWRTIEAVDLPQSEPGL